MILGTSEGVRHARGAAVDRSVRGCANVEFGELVEFGVDLVLGVAFALGLDLPGLLTS